MTTEDATFLLKAIIQQSLRLLSWMNERRPRDNSSRNRPPPPSCIQLVVKTPT